MHLYAISSQVSERGQKHVKELTAAVQAGHEAIFVFVIQRGDCSYFAPSWEKDPEYSRLLLEASRQGVKVVALRTEMRYNSHTSIATVDLIGLATVELDYKKEESEAARVAGGMTKVKNPKKVPKEGPGDGEEGATGPVQVQVPQLNPTVGKVKPKKPRTVA